MVVRDATSLSAPCSPEIPCPDYRWPPLATSGVPRSTGNSTVTVSPLRPTIHVRTQNLDPSLPSAASFYLSTRLFQDTDVQIHKVRQRPTALEELSGGQSIFSRSPAGQLIAITHASPCFFVMDAADVSGQHLHAAGITSVQQSPAAATIAKDHPRRSIPASSHPIRFCSVQ